ncbi:MAG: type II toxin-antitoxin system HicB family antitoxin [Streptosporangiaceae bacterium]
MSKAEKIIEQMQRSPRNVRFDDLAKVCADHFGEPRQDGTSHKVYKTPWQGDPRVNIQRGKGAMPRRTKYGRCSMQSPGWKPRRTRRVTTMPDATHYTYRVAWSVEDGEHVATVAEFPSLSWLAPTPVEALAGLANVVRDVLADLAVSGEPIPEPLSERTYSGKFVVRVPAEVHRRLVREAAEQHVSLNRLVSDRLARA